jgi:hypothetical protein
MARDPFSLEKRYCLQHFPVEENWGQSRLPFAAWATCPLPPSARIITTEKPNPRADSAGADSYLLWKTTPRFEFHMLQTLTISRCFLM